MVFTQNISKVDALDKLNHSRFCCRRMFLGHNPKIEDDKNLYSRVSTQKNLHFFENV
jgi:DNA-directed RNA polymerase subunit N (RpoN/RPB10)